LFTLLPFPQDSEKFCRSGNRTGRTRRAGAWQPRIFCTVNNSQRSNAGGCAVFGSVIYLSFLPEASRLILQKQCSDYNTNFLMKQKSPRQLIRCGKAKQQGFICFFISKTQVAAF
jgi:hypothetical protein